MDMDVIIIGAGAAGLFCAAHAAQRGRRVLLIEHAQNIGERIRISGGGHCNFTNREVSAKNYLSQNPHFCHSALAQYSAADFIAFITSNGIAYHEKTLGQLFCDGSATQITNLLIAQCLAAEVQWAHPAQVLHVEKIAKASSTEATPHNPRRFCVHTNVGTFRCTSLVVACGGLAVPTIGATPLGYQLAEQFGVPVIAPSPALVPLALAPDTLDVLRPLAGVSLPVMARGYTHAPQFAEDLLITHRGLSGPAILQASSYWQQHTPRAPITLDLLPGIDPHVLFTAASAIRQSIAQVLAEHMPRRFAQAWAQIHGYTQPIGEMSHQALEHAAQLLKHWTLMPSGTLGYAKAEVTLGGIDTRALSSKTMQVSAVPGLFFIGEVVDVTGWLGGYNFQWAWSSGWVAAQHC